VSLILEALKKLDREKKAPERGFLVVGAVPWPAPRPRRWLPAAVVAAAGVAAGLALVLAWRARDHEDTPRRVAVPATMAAVAPAPVTTLAAATPATPPPAAESRPPASETRKPVPPAAEAPIELPAARATPAMAAPPGAGLQLQAISVRDGRPIAVLNDRLVHEGDHFDGVTIVRIGADEVEIEVQGRRRTLRF
jgi:hypothetical protein